TLLASTRPLLRLGCRSQQRAKQRTFLQNSAKYSAAPSTHRLARNAKKPLKNQGFLRIHRIFLGLTTTPKGTRTPVFWLRTRHPRPLDDGGGAIILRDREGDVKETCGVAC